MKTCDLCKGIIDDCIDGAFQCRTCHVAYDKYHNPIGGSMVQSPAHYTHGKCGMILSLYWH